MTSIKPIGIVIATRWEACRLIKKFRFQKMESNLYRGEPGGQPVWLAISGVGPEKARAAAYRLCDKGAGELISVGFCGALVSQVKIGDLITHRIATSSKPVRTVEERQALANRANALAVDMETQAIIEAGTRRGVPIRTIRVVSDEIQDDLSPIFGKNGTFSPWAIAFRLMNPLNWPLANRLRQNSNLAKSRLADALQNYFNERS